MASVLSDLKRFHGSDDGSAARYANSAPHGGVRYPIRWRTTSNNITAAAA